VASARLRAVPSRVHRSKQRSPVPYLRALDPLTGAVIRASKTTAVRYEREQPGELVHMDVKKVGRIPDGGGWRAHGRAAREATRDRSTKIGFDYGSSAAASDGRHGHRDRMAARCDDGRAERCPGTASQVERIAVRVPDPFACGGVAFVSPSWVPPAGRGMRDFGVASF
jgi:hypothetical protein